MNHIAALGDLIERVTGIVVPAREMDRLRLVAERRAMACGQETLPRYIRYLADGGDSDEWRALLGFITVNESYLFRGAQQLAALADTVIPRLMADRPTRKLTLWSAGCARGEEAASLAIVLARTLGMADTSWRILATDLDENSIVSARAGRYGTRAMAKVEPELLRRYFTPVGGAFELVPRLLDRITFRTLNLVSEPVRPAEAPFDVVFLRNVLIYFRPNAQRRVVEAVADTLTPDGVVFVGPSESLWQLRSSLEPEDLGSCFCYRRGSPRPRGIGSPTDGGAVRRVEARPAVTDRTIGCPPPVPPGSGLPLDPGPGAGDLPAAGLVAAEVADLIERAAPEEAAARATDASRRSPDDPALRAIEGRVNERTGELERAVAAYRAALYLEPSMCEVRFLMAECLDRLGRHHRACREVRAVLASIASKTCTPVHALEPLGRPSLAHMEWRAREMLGARD